MDILQAKKPEFAEEIEVIIEDERKKSTEKAEKEREEWRKGIWHYNVVMSGLARSHQVRTILIQTQETSLSQDSVGQERRTLLMWSGRSWRGNGQRMSRMIGTNI